jgi:hypothetical protein
MKIRPPVRAENHPDREVECEEAIEASVFAILDAAQADDTFDELYAFAFVLHDAQEAGWREAEVIAAVHRLIDAHAKATLENALTEAAISRARMLH